ncbi:SDR family NAD(P)-dependent oxidoreductase [Actinosynnema pretiosum subsp. pretiosum]|uniref:Short-chain dehydrogenase/reductase SDR n=2 Tax=Actinosynnema TaxID=40566 RepID=C6W9D0_ACTMD|nr:oxidoreductase [Actinosynnema mirum]ACU35293.1 short-chain dehydrogenase/reductase SDR [Actinosynnema mirum DSM 43827]AXX28664.1 short chain dehydrogenase [Actinosynnema pretiosum subsp. pretiosum]QUF07011.1 SDR family NAD(P)-dependent oxidoreductase [Actinosynnema pretiosum subsp. pretiosum]
MAKWTEVDIPDQAGRTALVTGANSGLGLRTAEVLAAKGARVLLACRSGERGLAAVERVSRHGEAEFVRLDLGEPASVRAAAERVQELAGDGLDLLVNNAGLMAPPLARTADGFESQFGVNHLGHAALTWLLMPALRARAGARVVTVSSVAHRLGGLDLADPNFEVRRYAPWVGYGQSKLANLLFARELDRRLARSGADVTSVAAHPGVSRTELSSTMAKSHRNALVEWGGKITDAVSQTPAMGALPQLYAATAPLVTGGGYYGPDGFGGFRGHPAPARSTAAGRDDLVAARLWDLTAELTGVAPDPA